MSRCLRLLAALVCVAVMPLAPAAAQAPNESALVAFGGFEGLARITNDFVGRIQKHPRIGSFFKDADTERLQAMLADQFCDVLGGGCKYSGKSMRKVHEGMKVTTADFNALAEELQNALDAAAVPSSQQNRLIAALAPMRRDVVQP